MLRIPGGRGAALGRRWLRALFRLPEGDRARLVEEAERLAARESEPDVAPMVHVRGERVQRDGYIEQSIRSYGPRPGRQARRRASG